MRRKSLEKLKASLPDYISIDFSQVTRADRAIRAIDAQYGEYWVTPSRIMKGGGKHKTRRYAERTANNIIKYGVSCPSQLPENRAKRSAVTKARKGLTEADFITRLPSHIKIDFSTYQGSHNKARFIHAEYGEWWQRPSDTLRFKRHPVESGKLTANALRAPMSMIIAQLPKELSMDESTYKSTHQKAKFFDREVGLWWWATPNNILSGDMRHPELKTFRMERDCEEKFKLVGAFSKECVLCRVNKPISAFSKYKKNDDGHETRCKKCRVEKRHTQDMVLSRRWAYGRGAATARNREWSIDFQTYIGIVSNNCHYCHCSLRELTGASLDRIDNSRDYTVDNVLPCCGDCNQIRGDRLTVHEMEVAMAAVLKLRNIAIP